MPAKYLFILSPPYSGSTVLWRLLQTSSQVSALPDEGQKLPELRSMMRERPWDPDTVFDWELVSKTWHRYWDGDKAILLEKSPPHLCRSAILEQHFKPTHFICLMRDPLAICEALHRRNDMDWEAAAQRWIEWLTMLLETLERRPDSHLLYYEDMVARPRQTFTALASWLPELRDVDYRSAIEAHSVEGVQRRPLSDMNPQKLSRIAPAEKQRVVHVLQSYPSLLARTPYGAHYL